MSAQTNIRDVVFDLGLVLLDWNPRYLFVDHLGYESEQVEAFLESVCTSQWHAAIDAGRSFQDAAALLLPSYPEYQDWINAYSQQWHYMFKGQIEASVEALQTLHGKGYRVHALSNYPGEKIQFLYKNFQTEQANLDTDKIVQSCHRMSEDLTGALIVVAHTHELREIIDTGEEINATISGQLIENLFFLYPNTKLISIKPTLPPWFPT